MWKSRGGQEGSDGKATFKQSLTYRTLGDVIGDLYEGRVDNYSEGKTLHNYENGVVQATMMSMVRKYYA